MGPTTFTLLKKLLDSYPWTGEGEGNTWHVILMGEKSLDSISTIWYVPLSVLSLLLAFTDNRFTNGANEPDINNGTRIGVVEFLINNPGVTVAAMSKELGKNYVTIERHVKALEKENRIKCLKLWGRNYWFNNDKDLGTVAMRLIAATSDRTRQALLTRLYTSPGTSLIDLVAISNVSFPTVNSHLQKLHEIGLVKKNKNGKTVNYFLTDELQRDSISYARLESMARKTRNNLKSTFGHR